MSEDINKPTMQPPVDRHLEWAARQFESNLPIVNTINAAGCNITNNLLGTFPETCNTTRKIVGERTKSR